MSKAVYEDDSFELGEETFDDLWEGRANGVPVAIGIVARLLGMVAVTSRNNDPRSGMGAKTTFQFFHDGRVYSRQVRQAFDRPNIISVAEQFASEVFLQATGGQ